MLQLSTALARHVTFDPVNHNPPTQEAVVYFLTSTGESVRGNKDFTAASVLKAVNVAQIPELAFLSDSQQPLLDDTGSVSASDTREFMYRLGLLATSVASGLVRKADSDDNLAERLAALSEAPTADNWHNVGKLLCARVNAEYQEHRLSRRLLLTRYVPKGAYCPLYMHLDHTYAAVSNNPERIGSGNSTGIFSPEWFNVIAALPPEPKSVLRSFGLDAFNKAQRSMISQFVVAENKALLRLLQAASNMCGNRTADLPRGLDFYMWRRMADSLSVAATTTMIAHTAWLQMVLSSSWGTSVAYNYSGPEQDEQAFEGRFGSFAGVDINTDGHVAEHLRTLDKQQVIMAIPDRSLGVVQYMQGDDNFHVTDKAIKGASALGLHMNRCVSMAVLTVNGVAVGTVAK